jgi:hypothetical protein
MLDITTAHLDIHERNRTRAHARLPLLSPARQLRRLYEADRERQFPYEVKTRRCTVDACRYRWDIWVHGRRVHSSTDSFASREKATAAGHAELERLGKTLRTGE